MFDITEDDGFQLIQRFNYEWKICPIAFLGYGTLNLSWRGRGTSAHGAVEH